MRTLEIIAVSRDGSVAKDVLVGDLSDEEALALAACGYVGAEVVELWEAGVLVARVGADERRPGLWPASWARAQLAKFHRMHGELVLAVASGALAALTIVEARWVEVSTGMSIDGGSGVFEWALTAILLIVAVLATVSARRRYRRQIAATDS